MEKRQKKTCIKTEGKNGWTASIKTSWSPIKTELEALKAYMLQKAA